MSTTTTVFKDNHGKNISREQKSNVEDYSELIFKNNILKERFYYSLNKIFYAEYFMHDEEDINGVLLRLNNTVRWCVMSDFKIISSYTVCKSNGLLNNNLS